IGVEGNMSGDRLVERLLGGGRARSRRRYRSALGIYSAQRGLEYHVQRLSDSGIRAASGGGAQISEFYFRTAGHRRDHQRYSLRQRQPGGATLRQDRHTQ